ncbi:MAG: hypothetical protein IPF55_11855 [Rhodoferax sp.]|nr:hypothetical protein [Rhodoferax sp.]
MNYERAPLLDQLAGAYVLGTLSARARRRFGVLLDRSAAAQRAVAQWNDHLAPLNNSITPVAPRPQVWQAVAQSTQPIPGRISWLQRLDASLSGWFKPALAFSLGLMLTVGLVQQAPQTLGLAPIPTKSAPSYVGLLTNAQGEPVLAATSLRRGSVLTVRLLKPLDIPPGQVAVLWALPVEGTPIAVSTVPASGKIDIALGAPSEVLFSKVSRLAVSFEANAQTTAPSGPYVISGHCVKLW